jgi:hypothetical protein
LNEELGREFYDVILAFNILHSYLRTFGISEV